MAEARRAWADAAPRLDPDKLVFLDETWATTALTRARAPRGERLVCPVPHGRWRTTTFLCALRADGLVAPLVLDGAIDGPAFLAWVEQMLAPTLRPGDTVLASAATRSPACARRSRRAGRRCSTFLRTAPT